MRERRRARQNSVSLLNSMADPEAMEILGRIVRPDVQPSGLVTFSLAGFGDFAMILSADVRVLRVVDLNRGTEIRVSNSAGPENYDAAGNGAFEDGAHENNKRKRGYSSNIFWRIVYYVLITLRHPLVIVGLVVLLAVSVLWGFSRRLRRRSRRRPRRRRYGR